MTGVNLIPASILAAQAARRHLKGWCLVVVTALAANALPLVADVVNAARAAELRRERDALSREVVEVRREADAVTAEAADSLARLERLRFWRRILAMRCCSAERAPSRRASSRSASRHRAR